MTEWPKEDKIQGRKPDKHSVYRTPIKYIQKRKWWEKEKKPELQAMTIGQSETGTLDKYKPDNGILAEDVFFAGLEDEIERVNKKLGL